MKNRHCEIRSRKAAILVMAAAAMVGIAAAGITAEPEGKAGEAVDSGGTGTEIRFLSDPPKSDPLTAEPAAPFDPAGRYTDDIGSDLTIRKRIDGSYLIEHFSIYKLTMVENIEGVYDPETDTLSFSGRDDWDEPLAAEVTPDGECLSVLLTACGHWDPMTGTVMRFYPLATGYPDYDMMLAELCDLRKDGCSAAECARDGLLFRPELMRDCDAYQKSGWTLRDLDGDGTPELLLGADREGYGSVIYQIYRTEGWRSPSEVTYINDYHSLYRLCTDGGLACEWQEGDTRGYGYYRLENMDAPTAETLYFDGTGWWYYLDTALQDADLLPTMWTYLNWWEDGETYIEKNFRPIDESAAKALMNRHTFEELSFTPFYT